MGFRKNTILAAIACGCYLGCLSGCSSAPIKMECRELQARMDYGDLSADQQRFARQELDECRGRVQAAEAKDSAFIDATERRLTPSDSDGTGADAP